MITAVDEETGRFVSVDTSEAYDNETAGAGVRFLALDLIDASLVNLRPGFADACIHSEGRK